MGDNMLLDILLIGLGILMVILGMLLNEAIGVPIGVGAVVIGMVGLEAKSIKKCIRQSCVRR